MEKLIILSEQVLKAKDPESAREVMETLYETAYKNGYKAGWRDMKRGNQGVRRAMAEAFKKELDMIDDVRSSKWL